MKRTEIYKLIDEERKKQDNKFGEYNKTNTSGAWIRIILEELGEAAKTVNDIDLGDFYNKFECDMEACKHKDLIILEKELKNEIIQTIALCVAWLEADFDDD